MANLVPRENAKNVVPGVTVCGSAVPDCYDRHHGIQAAEKPAKSFGSELGNLLFGSHSVESGANTV